MAGHPQLHFENRYIRKDGQVVHIMWATRWSPADQLRIGVARDITERKYAESKQAALYAISEAALAAEDLPALFHHIHQIVRSEEHTSELQSLMRISYAVFCLKKKKQKSP